MRQSDIEARKQPMINKLNEVKTELKSIMCGLKNCPFMKSCRCTETNCAWKYAENYFKDLVEIINDLPKGVYNDEAE